MSIIFLLNRSQNSCNIICIILLLGCLVFITPIAIAGEADDFPVTVIDDLDQELTLARQPERIISLAPAQTEVLFALGADDRLVGVTTEADYPPEAREKPVVGSMTEPGIEEIVSREPDLVLTAPGNKMETIDRLRELGITVAGFRASSVRKTIVNIKKIGRLVGQSATARELVTDMYLHLGEITGLVEEHLEQRERPRVFYEIWNDPLYTAGEDTFIDNMIELAGGRNVGARARSQWPRFNLEELLVADPKIYVASPHSASGGVTVESIKNRAQYRTLTAVKNDRVYLVDEDLVNRPSPRVIQGLTEMVRVIWPGLVKELEDKD